MDLKENIIVAARMKPLRAVAVRRLKIGCTSGPNEVPGVTATTIWRMVSPSMRNMNSLFLCIIKPELAQTAWRSSGKDPGRARSTIVLSACFHIHQTLPKSIRPAAKSLATALLLASSKSKMERHRASVQKNSNWIHVSNSVDCCSRAFSRGLSSAISAMRHIQMMKEVRTYMSTRPSPRSELRVYLYEFAGWIFIAARMSMQSLRISRAMWNLEVTANIARWRFSISQMVYIQMYGAIECMIVSPSSRHSFSYVSSASILILPVLEPLEPDPETPLSPTGVQL
mmetsp:Transcript_67370/g.133510  ORF Transcript_67370/g.133510 Transcript_67370/m.133510 type:complete len:284 (-) Transcript_67370:233-1084(-)